MSDDLLTAGVELKGYVTTLLGNLEKDVDGQFDKWCAPVTGTSVTSSHVTREQQSDQVATLREQEDERQRALQRALFRPELSRDRRDGLAWCRPGKGRGAAVVL